MSIKDGGPFHPCEVSWNDGEMTGGIQTGNRSGINTGASLRDHFAGLAMNGILSNQSFDGATKEEVAGMSYEIADAMIRAREAGQ